MKIMNTIHPSRLECKEKEDKKETIFLELNLQHRTSKLFEG